MTQWFFLKIWSRGGALEQNEQKPENGSRAPPSDSILIIFTLKDRKFFTNSESVYTMTDLTLVWQVLLKFDLWWLFVTWSDLNNFEYQFPTNFWAKTYVYLMYFDQPGRFDAYWTDLTLVWPLMTFCDLIWLQIILNFNFRQNSESKNMYIWCIST